MREVNKLGKSQKLTQAKVNKFDEFYTQLEDIEKELQHYKKFFENKVVFCNCDDPYESHFFKYFAMNFNTLKLKKLIATCYDNSIIMGREISLFDIYTLSEGDRQSRAFKIEINEVYDFNKDGATDLVDIELLIKNQKNVFTVLEENGDFRSKECIELLKRSDIIVTNPPFSLFIEYIEQLLEYNKQFLIIGNQTAAGYKEIFPHIKNNKIWWGLTMNGSNRYFQVPDSYELTEKTGKIVDGKKYAFVKGVRWFTNLPTNRRNEDLFLYKKYDPEIYPTYSNFDGIDVNKVESIPLDYFGNMGVPLTFLDKYNPNQFELVGIGAGDVAKQIGVKKNYRGRTDLAFKENNKDKCPFGRIIIKRRKEK